MVGADSGELSVDLLKPFVYLLKLSVHRLSKRFNGTCEVLNLNG